MVERAGLAIDLAHGQHYLVSFAVNWTGPEDDAEVAKDPLLLVVADRSVRQGDVIDTVKGPGSTTAGQAERKGRASVTFRTGAAFILADVPSVTVRSRFWPLGPRA